MLALLLAAVAASQGESQLLPTSREAVYLLVERGTRVQHRGALRALYRSTGYELVWIRGAKPTPQALALATQFERAAQKGLRASDYEGPLWRGRMARLEQPVQLDVAFSACAIRYVSDLGRGCVNPRALKLGLRVDADESELGAQVARLSHAQSIDAELTALEPAFPGYRRSLEALQQYLALAARGDGERVPAPRKPVEPDTFAGARQLARRLALLGDLPASAALPDGQEYRGDLVAAVARFQSRHGLAPTGRIDAATVRRLNVPLGKRVAQLQLTLERLRWLPRSFASPPLVVNIPEFRLHAGDADFHRAFSMKVVVGRAWHHQTPVFAGAIDSVIFRPYWEVPRDIAADELVPSIEKDPALLSREDYEIVDGRGNPVDGGIGDAETLAQVRDGRLRIRQRPGDHNALGGVKFVFPNEYSVYLHGTPASKLFARARRDFSHGCIRVEDPERLAEWVLRGDPSWTSERIRAAMTGDDTIRVNLRMPVPVLILYSTAVAAEDGEVRFFEDIYRLDLRLQRALGDLPGA